MTLILFIYGCCMGSFIVAAAHRYTTHESLLFPASHCDWCQTPLAAWQLVPGVSYWLLRGRCFYCHSPIPPTTVLVELGCGLLLTTYHTPTDWHPIAWLLLWGYAALCDRTNLTFPAWIGVANLLVAPHIWSFSTGAWLLGSYFLIHVLWPRWPRPWIGDGDLEFIISYLITWGLWATSQWLVVACGLALATTRKTPRARFAFIPALTLSAWFWWGWSTWIPSPL
ncbi:prepilin peptidase [Levilactobacillus suantsaii]|uniref:Prepilin peptidase n=1 Tax=Levilactobacillus suantsaii TaxID=2292255 RepID=A0A4Q0VJX0_9LACO|nr:A24 family peptidase [Levilactobacillus suantsaii]QMU08013.1 prepilin peptidase [Levilactobacillus suantsaii]RXI79892.1 prepilin peptidase [Levilactobacillus suantsaii]